MLTEDVDPATVMSLNCLMQFSAAHTGQSGDDPTKVPSYTDFEMTSRQAAPNLIPKNPREDTFHLLIYLVVYLFIYLFTY